MKLGDKVEYLSGDKWKKGIIHAVKKAQDTNDNDLILSYLIDTGNDERLDEIPHDVRGDFITEKAHEIIADSKNPITDFTEAAAEVEAGGNLPKSKIVIEKVRQPEQVEVLPENIRAVK